MLVRLIKFLVPGHSRRGKYLRRMILRIRKRRSIAHHQAQYNGLRTDYYRHDTAMAIADISKKISIVVPCFNTPTKYFEPLLTSVFAQSYPNWELVLADASNDPVVIRRIKHRAKADDRIVYLKINNGGIAINTNQAIAKSSGDYIAFLDHDDTLDPNALTASLSLMQLEDCDLVYSDEDKISDDGEKYFEPHFKPGFSLDMLRNVNYITHFVVAKKALVEKVGGIHTGFDGAQDYDFLLRAVDAGAKIGHVPYVLYHWRQADGSTASNFSNKTHVTDAGCQALLEHYQRNMITNIDTIYAIKDRPGFYRARYHAPEGPLKIYLDLEIERLLPIEREYLLEQYRVNDHVVMQDIKIIEGLPKKQTANDLVIHGAIIPLSNKTDVLSLFALAQEPGVQAVAPLVSRHGRIYDMGVVQVDGQKRALFKDVNPERYRSFGSLEWVRNVDAVSGRIAVRNPSVKSGRSIIYSHSEFVAFETQVTRLKLSRGAEFYSPNICEITEIFEARDDYISDLVRIKQ